MAHNSSTCDDLTYDALGIGCCNSIKGHLGETFPEIYSICERRFDGEINKVVHVLTAIFFRESTCQLSFNACMYIPMLNINIDQEKAFDRVSHEYLFRVLKAFGLGDRFISFIKLCYIDVSSFININGSACVSL